MAARIHSERRRRKGANGRSIFSFKKGTFLFPFLAGRAWCVCSSFLAAFVLALSLFFFGGGVSSHARHVTSDIGPFLSLGIRPFFPAWKIALFFKKCRLLFHVLSQQQVCYSADVFVGNPVLQGLFLKKHTCRQCRPSTVSNPLFRYLFGLATSNPFFAATATGEKRE